MAHPFADLGEGYASDEALPRVTDAKWTRATILLGDEDRPYAEADLGPELVHGKKLTGPVAVVAVPEEDGLHDCIVPQKQSSSFPSLSYLSIGRAYSSL